MKHMNFFTCLGQGPIKARKGCRMRVSTLAVDGNVEGSLNMTALIALTVGANRITGPLHFRAARSSQVTPPPQLKPLVFDFRLA